MTQKMPSSWMRMGVSDIDHETYKKKFTNEEWNKKKEYFINRYAGDKEFKQIIDRGRYMAIYQRMKYECDKEYAEKKKATALKYNKENPEKHNEAAKKYQKNNADKVSEYRKNYYINILKPRRQKEQQERKTEKEKKLLEEKEKINKEKQLLRASIKLQIQKDLNLQS